jgi:hypothetical protein
MARNNNVNDEIESTPMDYVVYMKPNAANPILEIKGVDRVFIDNVGTITFHSNKMIIGVFPSHSVSYVLEDKQDANNQIDE